MSSVEKYQAPAIDEITHWAEKFAESGMFTDARQVVQAFVKISAGAELGLTPFQSMSGVHIIQGKPVVGAGLLASLLDRDPAYDYRVEWEPSEADPSACTVIVIKNGNERGRSRFSLEDASRAGLNQPNWKKYPAAMLFARAMSQAVRWYAPGATGTSVYVEGEIEPHVPATPAPSNGATAKPRTRVTAEVVTEDVAAEDVEVEPEPYSLTRLLKAMSAHDRAELYDTVGIERGTKAPDVLLILRAELDKMDMPDTPEPDPVQILTLLRRHKRAIVDMDPQAVESFQRFADTGEDLDHGDQATLDAEAMA